MAILETHNSILQKEWTRLVGLASMLKDRDAIQAGRMGKQEKCKALQSLAMTRGWKLTREQPHEPDMFLTKGQHHPQLCEQEPAQEI